MSCLNSAGSQHSWLSHLLLGATLLLMAQGIRPCHAQEASPSALKISRISSWHSPNAVTWEQAQVRFEAGDFEEHDQTRVPIEGGGEAWLRLEIQSSGSTTGSARLWLQALTLARATHFFARPDGSSLRSERGTLQPEGRWSELCPTPLFRFDQGSQLSIHWLRLQSPSFQPIGLQVAFAVPTGRLGEWIGLGLIAGVLLIPSLYFFLQAFDSTSARLSFWVASYLLLALLTYLLLLGIPARLLGSSLLASEILLILVVFLGIGVGTLVQDSFAPIYSIPYWRQIYLRSFLAVGLGMFGWTIFVQLDAFLFTLLGLFWLSILNTAHNLSAWRQGRAAAIWIAFAHAFAAQLFALGLGAWLGWVPPLLSSYEFLTLMILVIALILTGYTFYLNQSNLQQHLQLLLQAHASQAQTQIYQQRKSELIHNLSAQWLQPLQDFQHQIEEALPTVKFPPETNVQILSLQEDLQTLTDELELLIDLARTQEYANLQPESFVLEDACRETIQLVEHRTTPGQRIQLENPDLQTTVLGDRRAIQLVLLSLLENSLHHTQSRQILLRLRPDAGEQVEIVICDEGPGLPPHVIQALKNPRGSAVGAFPRHRGRGISLCQELLQAHGQRLQAEISEQGALLKFHLPIVASLPQTQPQGIWAEASPAELLTAEFTVGFSSHRLEDETLWELLLRPLQAELRTLPSNLDLLRALEKLEQQEGLPDLLIFEAETLQAAQQGCVRVRERYSSEQLPVLLILPGLLKVPPESFLSEIDDFLSMPWQPSATTLKIQRLLQLSHLHKSEVLLPVSTTPPPLEALVKLQGETLRVWMEVLGKEKRTLLQESGQWSVHYDRRRQRWRTQVFDQYLTVSSLPKRPRWKNVIATADFVLAQLEGSEKEALEQLRERVVQYFQKG